MLSKSSTEFMSILYQFFKIGYGIGLVIICVAVICYAYRIISLNKKCGKSGFKNGCRKKDDSFHQRGKEYKDTVKQ